jgi:hypothetical protein
LAQDSQWAAEIKAASRAAANRIAKRSIHKDLKSSGFGRGIFLQQPSTLAGGEERFGRRKVFNGAEALRSWPRPGKISARQYR